MALLHKAQHATRQARQAHLLCVRLCLCLASQHEERLRVRQCEGGVGMLAAAGHLIPVEA